MALKVDHYSTIIQATLIIIIIIIIIVGFIYDSNINAIETLWEKKVKTPKGQNAVFFKKSPAV